MRLIISIKEVMMTRSRRFIMVMALAAFCISGIFPGAVYAAPFKVLVVMSYHEDIPWSKDIKAGISSVLSGENEIRYAYLDTIRNFEAGEAKAKEIYELYQAFQPDGVIVGDDNAQFMFTVPYLRDKVKTPVMFCGVNEKPEKYGYPASNVSGVLERIHFRESIAFLQLLVPSVKTIGFIMAKNDTSEGYHQQIKSEMASYSAVPTEFRFPETLDQGIQNLKELETKCDAIFIDNIIGLKGKDGNPVDEKGIVSALAKVATKPTFCANAFNLKYGILCSVVKTGHEQGETSAEMLLKAMKGTPVSEIPITRNHKGKPMVNIEVMRNLGIKPRAKVLHTAELVKTEK